MPHHLHGHDENKAKNSTEQALKKFIFVVELLVRQVEGVVKTPHAQGITIRAEVLAATRLDSVDSYLPELANPQNLRVSILARSTIHNGACITHLLVRTAACVNAFRSYMCRRVQFADLKLVIIPGSETLMIARKRMKMVQFANSKNSGYPGPSVRKASRSAHNGISSTSISWPQQGQHYFTE
jgi:hypothetical protein